MADAPVRVGIVGAGVMGRDHVRNAMNLQREGVVQLVGLADVDVARAQALGAEHSVPAFERYEALLDETAPEFVVVATPHPAHEAVTVAAARRGIHVLCEKPIAHTVSSADRMLAACTQAGVLLGMDFNQRTTPGYIKARELVANGVLGDLYRVSFVASGWYRTQAYYDSGGWRGTWAGEGGGVIMNQAPHHLDLYCWLAGRPDRVKATALTRTHEIEVENTMAALLEHGRERVDTFYTTTAEWPGRTELVIAGQKGRLVVAERQLRLYRLERTLNEEIMTGETWGKPAGAWEEVEVAPGDPARLAHTGVLARFAQAVRSGNESDLIATGADGLRALELANAMLLSSFRDRAVTLPIDRAEYDALLTELQHKAAAGEFRKRQGGAAAQGLATLPESA